MSIFRKSVIANLSEQNRASAILCLLVARGEPKVFELINGCDFISFFRYCTVLFTFQSEVGGGKVSLRASAIFIGEFLVEDGGGGGRAIGGAAAAISNWPEIDL